MMHPRSSTGPVRSIHRTLAAFLLLALLLALSASPLSAASTNDAYYQSKIAELKAQAEADHYRFIDLGTGGFDAEIAADILENDGKVIEQEPVGSVTVHVVEPDTGKPVSGALVVLTASLSSYTSSGTSSTQTANAFLSINLGETDSNGSVVWENPLFYHSKIGSTGEDPTEKYIGQLASAVGSVDDGARIVMMTNAADVSYTPEGDAGLGISLLVKDKVMDETAFFDAVKALDGIQKPDEAIYTLFNSKYVMYTDDSPMQLYTGSNMDAFQPLIDRNDGACTVGELREYIAAQRALLDERFTKRSYRTLGDYTPSYEMYFKAPVETTSTYKDGTKTTDRSSRAVYVQYFGGVAADKGVAIPSFNFYYRIYAYHPDYASGESIGAYVDQDLIDKDVSLTLHFSKDMPPVAAGTTTATLFGRLLDPSGKAVSGARVYLDGTSQYRVTGSDGAWSFAGLEPGTQANLLVAMTEGDRPTAVKAFWNGSTYNSDEMDLPLLADTSYRINLGSAGSAGGTVGILKYLVYFGIFLLFVFLLVVLLLLAGRRKKRRLAVAPAAPVAYAAPTAPTYVAPNAPTYVAPAAPTYVAPAAPLAPAAPVAPVTPQPVFVAPVAPPAAPLLSCANCGGSLAANANFCKACGTPVLAAPVAAPIAAPSVQRTCTQCGKAAAPEARFCNSCGAPACPSCGRFNRADATFCAACGGRAK